MLTDFINFKTAEFLCNRIGGEDGYKYAAEDVVCTFDNNTSVVKKERGDLIDTNYCTISGKTYSAPTVAEVLDYVTKKFEIFIAFTPWFTFALNEHVAYTYKAFKINHETAKIKEVFSSEDELASMDLCLLEILKKVMTE